MGREGAYSRDSLVAILFWTVDRGWFGADPRTFNTKGEGESYGLLELMRATDYSVRMDMGWVRVSYFAVLVFVVCRFWSEKDDTITFCMKYEVTLSRL